MYIASADDVTSAVDEKFAVKLPGSANKPISSYRIIL